MTPTPSKTNHELVNSLWKQTIRNAKEISKKKLEFPCVPVNAMSTFFGKMAKFRPFIDWSLTKIIS